MPDGPSDDRRLDDILNIITTLARLSIDGGYIFRGEPKHYDRVASRKDRAAGERPIELPVLPLTKAGKWWTIRVSWAGGE